MSRTILVALFCSLFFLAQARGQEVSVPRQAKPVPVKESVGEPIVTVVHAPAPIAKLPPVAAAEAKSDSIKVELVKAPPVKAEPPRLPPVKAEAVKADPVKTDIVKAEPEKATSPNLPPVIAQSDGAFTKLADGFDFPVGKPEAQGYYKARGFRANGHLGEDWDGIGGGDTDLGDPVYSIGEGFVVFSRDVHMGWGNVLIIRHSYRENGVVKSIDVLYGHLDSMRVSRGQRVARGQQIATIGNAHGQYDAHLHLEIRKNIEIGMSRAKFQKDFSNYHDPTQFIATHRHLAGGGSKYPVAMNTYTRDATLRFDPRDFSARRRSNVQSSAALKSAVSSTTR
ncbi:MAG: peptidoglycan DD-metalloendopeptidase family protein [Verrucomicrobiota bacterium]